MLCIKFNIKFCFYKSAALYISLATWLQNLCNYFAFTSFISIFLKVEIFIQLSLLKICNLPAFLFSFSMQELRKDSYQKYNYQYRLYFQRTVSHHLNISISIQKLTLVLHGIKISQNHHQRFFLSKTTSSILSFYPVEMKWFELCWV